MIYFVSYCQSKNHRQRHKKETTKLSEMFIQNIKKSPGIDVALSNCTGEMGIDKFRYLNSSLYFLFCKKYGVLAGPPLPPPPSEYTYFLDNPQDTDSRM